MVLAQWAALLGKAQKLRAAVAVYGGIGAPAMPRVMRLGDRGADVAALQVALGIAADGAFGPATDAAVRRVQAARALLVDGMVGAMTRSVLGL